MTHIQLVWASLWSDRALLYRQELSLDIEKSAMGVIVQELVSGERSGVVFGKSPVDDSQAVVEAVHGLNQGMVDGTVEPDRWLLQRKTGIIISHSPAKREKAMAPSPQGIRLESLSPEKSDTPPLSEKDINEVYGLARRAEEIFESPQDVEWTFKEKRLFALQSRPITTTTGETSDKERSWYLSLKKSFENLRSLREKIEDELIPAMIDEAEKLAGKDPAMLSDTDLSAEILRRSRIHKEWEETYAREFIPFAHGTRLFGQVYNDLIHPADPYEFTNLLGGTQMASVQRNRLLAEMADMIRSDLQLAERLKNDVSGGVDHPFRERLDSFLNAFGDFSFAGTQATRDQEGTIKLLLQMASREPAQQQFRPDDVRRLNRKFLSRFEGERRTFAEDLLDLARASYQLRDDDNIYLGRIEAHYLAALDEGRRRISRRTGLETRRLEMNEIAKALMDPDYRPVAKTPPSKASKDRSLKARQIVGQPAGPGIGTGNARVIEGASDLFDFRPGEILVCDAIDPNMTFIVPLSAGIVERRGGMLIHGAIIAREYGLPCVTGVPDATDLIHTGQQVTVDGYSDSYRTTGHGGRVSGNCHRGTADLGEGVVNCLPVFSPAFCYIERPGFLQPGKD
jgi:pyruvate,water dikinase